MRNRGFMRGWHGVNWRRLALLAVLAGAAPSVADAQGGAPRRSCTDCEAELRRARALERLDSLRWEFEHEKLTDAQRDRLRREMALAVRDLQAAIGDLRVELGDIERAQAEAFAAPRVAYAYSTRPRGYLGVSFEGPNTEDIRGEERIIRFLAYPRIALVEPSSPAERAGIRAGDTLMAMNGIDVLEREISLTKLLVPNEALLLRLRREGAPKELKVIVGEAPSYMAQRFMPPPALAPTAADEPRGTTRVRTTPAPPVAPVPARPGAVTSVWVYSDGVAGAKVETVTEGLARALGVENGVLVVRAGPGTPARDAGLMDGDVIIQAAGSRVRSVADLRGALMRHSGQGGVKVVVLRERKQKELILRQ